MPMQLHGLDFKGPFEHPQDLDNQPGLFAVIDQVGEERHVLDVGQSSALSTDLLAHKRRDCWKAHRKGALVFYAAYLPDTAAEKRIQYERGIRLKHTPTCGDAPAT